LKELGFDPILKMPDFETFANGVVKRKVAINLMQSDDRYQLKLSCWIKVFQLEWEIG
jgi:hypothetical protein